MFHLRTFIDTAAVASLVAVLSIAASIANASSATEAVPQVTVATRNYDLSKDAGVAELYARIKRAAQAVCDFPDRPVLSQVARAKKCVDLAVEGAIENADIAALTTYHADKNRNAKATTKALTVANAKIVG